jgi:hypothetical protein
MRSFVIKIIFFAVLVFAFITITFLLADGYTDPYYLRLTSPRQSSLIVGSSRAAQAMKPGVIDSVLSRNDMYNFSFTRENSPYGPVYSKSIHRKLDKSSKGGIFILTVDPWMVSSVSEDPNNPDQFRENGLFLDNIRFVNLKPNYFYLLRETNASYLRMWFNFFSRVTGRKINNSVLLHENGWLEIDIPMDSVSVRQRTAGKFDDYRYNTLPYYHKSDFRLDSLKELITYLKDYGYVTMVRLPVPSELIKIEDEFYSDFEDEMSKISQQLNVPYLTFSKVGDNYLYTDGNHLYKDSATDVSITVAEWIRKYISE